MTENEQTLRDEAIAIAYVAARQRLDAEHHSRLTKAWELVIDGKITVYPEDACATVQGKDQPEYHVSDHGKVCTCVDHTSGKAPDRLCKHILAYTLYLRSVKRFEALVAAQYAAPTAAQEPLPEAPISINIKGTLAGVPGAQLTLRGWSMAEIAARADEVRAGAACLAGLVDSPPTGGAAAPAAAASASNGRRPEHWCELHGVALERQQNERGAWYSHRTAEGWCKGKRREPFVPPALEGGS